MVLYLSEALAEILQIVMRVGYMVRVLQKTGKFYSKIIMKYIGVFLFVGIMFVIFGTHGWYPNSDMYKITRIVYEILIPCLIGYGAGSAVGGKEGGVVAVLAVIGLAAADYKIGILGAMILGPVCGWVSQWLLKNTVERFAARTNMLLKNLMAAGLGVIFCFVSYYLIARGLGGISDLISSGIDILIDKKLIVLSSFLIEPAKILFLNNGINHGILTPLGIQQIFQDGESVLFLLETNPGPGLGVLAALFLADKKKRHQFGVGMFVQTIGGIHEVYFPFVLSNLRLLIALIGGGMAGIFCFLQTGAGLDGPVSPGSILTLLLMAGRENALPVLAGVGVSTGVSFGLSVWILKADRNRLQDTTKPDELEIAVLKPDEPGIAVLTQPDVPVDGKAEAEDILGQADEKMTPIQKIIFVCDGGVGSSMMGAALFRRKLAENGIHDVEVKACAADLLEEDGDLFVCQRSFAERCPEAFEGKNLYLMDNLLSVQEFDALLEQLS